MKNTLTPAGIEPATFRIVAHHLDHCATAVPCENGFSFEFKQLIVLDIMHITWRWPISAEACNEQIFHGLNIIICRSQWPPGNAYREV